MSQREQVIGFFQTACQDRALQNQLKPPCPPTRQGFAAVAQQWGYKIQGEDLDNYVRFYQFYEQFQGAVDRHQQGEENLATWLNKWEKHLKKMDSAALDDRQETIKRYL